MNIDPLADFVTYQSPYAMAENNPVLYVDVNGLGILNVLGNLWKRLKLAFKKVCSSNSCNNERVQESIRDAWKRPDFNWKKRKRKNKRRSKSKAKKSSSSSNNNDGIPKFSLPSPSFEESTITQLPTHSLGVTKAKARNNIGTIDDKIVNPGHNPFNDLISFGRGSIENMSKASTDIPKTPNNIQLLDQIAEIMINNPSSTIYLKLAVAKVRGTKAKQAVRKYNHNRFVNFTKELRNRGVPNAGYRVIHIPLHLKNIIHNNNVIDIYIPE